MSKKIKKAFDERGKLDTMLEIFITEVIGTAFLMYFGCMGLFASTTEVKPLPPMQGAIVFGFIVSSLIVAFGHISKAHLNPCVTLCAYLLGTISVITSLVYLVAEILGALLGVYLLRFTTQVSFDKYVSGADTNSTCGFCTTVIADSITVPQGFLIEFLATSMLIFVVCSVWDPRNVSNSDSVALKFGLLITTLSITAGPFTGASLNPARTLAPAIINGVWTYHWVYWLAPLSASAVTTSFYKYMYMRYIQSSSDDSSTHGSMILKGDKAETVKTPNLV